jgi:bifunctional UDP-N-acetylglucosamine pyrophosphorylase/glucosamine-1-phosphate N-acetyltransferase
MQAVLLAAGKSSRFKPFGNLPHKSAFNVMGKMLIEHTLESIHESGISQVVIVINPESPLEKLLGDGSKYGVSITYVVQQTAAGMGDALLAAESVLEDTFFLTSAYHVDFKDFKEDLEKQNKKGVVLLLQKTDHISLYGAAKVSDGKVVGLVEKPTEQADDLYRTVSLYLLNREFLEILGETPTEHYHFEKALAAMIKKSPVDCVITEKENVSLKYAWNLFGVKDYLLNQLKTRISEAAMIAENVHIEGTVVIEEGAKVFEGAILKGPVYIGKNCVVGNYTLIRSGAILEENARVGAYSEVKNSLIGKGSTFDSGTVLDSIIGEKVKIGANILTANVRLDRKGVKFDTGEGKVDTGLHSLGSIIGDGAKLGVRVTTMPGITIGMNAFIGPSTPVMNSVEANKKYYLKFEPQIEENS